MVLGIGIDIIEIHRVEKVMQKPKFVDRIYTSGEQKYLQTRNNNPSTAAGYFAAKEATAKALGTGFGKVKWTEIEVIREKNGRPGIKLHGNAKIAMENMGGSKILVSISHSRDNAIAQVIIC
ncbi:MAG: holo-ACP synthase [Clostridiales bacterium]|nr:holo-ACP synthase [Clostridiales bacterium]